MAEEQKLTLEQYKRKLTLLLANNDPEMTMVAQDMIKKNSLPFCIENNVLRPQYTDGQLWLKKFITVDEETLLMKDDADKMASTPYEVLVTGETGTGKELIAKAMIGERSGPIRAINCAGFPRDLVESELFGYVKGSYTGSGNTTEGLFLSAKDGIVFLDEISELPMDMQSKLLRALQEKSVRRVGSSKEEPINCKFVCATNRSLPEMVKGGLFKKDLYARISTLELDIKPLRERKCDIIPITQSLEFGNEFLSKYQSDLMGGLLDLSLNVRSLQQHVVRYKVLGRVMLIR